MLTFSDFNKKASVDECWKTHEQRGMKKKGGKMVPNCVPKGSMSENEEWWVDMFRDYIPEGRQAKLRAGRKANPPQVKLDKQKDQARRERERRAQAANKRVADAEAKARERAPERREQEQARKDRAARNAAASQRVKDAEAKARPAPTGTMKKPALKPKPKPNPNQYSKSEVRPKNMSQANQEASDTYRKQRTGIHSNIKRALGGDLIGARGKKGETEAVKKRREQDNREKRAQTVADAAGRAMDTSRDNMAGKLQAKEANPETKGKAVSYAGGSRS